MAHSVNVREFLQGFLGEADEHLGRIAGNLASIEGAPTEGHPRALTELLRSLHTLKGLAGMMGVEPVVELAHAMESVARVAARQGGVVPAQAIDPLVAGAKAIDQRIRVLAEGKPVPTAPEGVLSALDRIGEVPLDGSASTPLDRLDGIDPALVEKLAPSERAELHQALARGERVLQAVFVPSPTKADAGATISTVRAGIGTLGRIVRVLPRTIPRSDEAPGGLEFVLVVVTQSSPEQLAEAAGLAARDVTDLTAQPAVPRAAEPLPEDDAFDRATRRGMVRMDVARLDAALEHVSALGIGELRVRDEMQALRAAGVDVRRLESRLDEQDRRLRRMRAALLELRMVPLREVLEPLPLIVRGLRNATGKRVRLVVEVGDAELDKTVADRLFPALVHLVRNAVDHGIETHEVRRALGKPEEGLLRVEAAAPAGAMLELSLADDGAGIDAEQVARRAGTPVPSSATELLDILTTPGFSTRETATTTSGRGLGLDIVRQTVEALGGMLELDNRPGQGTTLRLRAPLTVAVLDVLSFVAGGERYLAPVTVVDALVEVERDRVVQSPRSGAGSGAPSLLQVRDDVMPLVSLRGMLGSPVAGEDATAMIVRRHGRPFAFGIDRMLGRHEVLVRPLTDTLVKVPGVSGSADLGDGRPTLVLDLAALSGMVKSDGAEGRGHE